MEGEPAQKRDSGAFDRRPVAVTGEPRAVVVLDLRAGYRLAPGEEAHDLRVIVEGEQIIEVRVGQPP
jgi:hypothetical protein